MEVLLSVGRMFRGAFPPVILASVRAFDADDEDGRSEAQALKKAVERALGRNSVLAGLLDMNLVGARVALGRDPVALKIGLAKELSREYSRLIFFHPRSSSSPPSGTTASWSRRSHD